MSVVNVKSKFLQDQEQERLTEEFAAKVRGLHVPDECPTVQSTNECGQGKDLPPADGSKAPA